MLVADDTPGWPMCRQDVRGGHAGATIAGLSAAPGPPSHANAAMEVEERMFVPSAAGLSQHSRWRSFVRLQPCLHGQRLALLPPHQVRPALKAADERKPSA